MRKDEWEEARRAQAEHLHAVWDKQQDWWAFCRRCNTRLTGTPKALREHKCEEEPNGTAR